MTGSVLRATLIVAAITAGVLLLSAHSRNAFARWDPIIAEVFNVGAGVRP